jgi:hypothetical protein
MAASAASRLPCGPLSRRPFSPFSPGTTSTPISGTRIRLGGSNRRLRWSSSAPSSSSSATSWSGRWTPSGGCGRPTRLLEGKIAPACFDFQALTSAGRYGRDALARLRALRGDARSAQIAAGAAAAAAQQLTELPPQTPASAIARWLVYPAGAALPPSFLAQDWSSYDQTAGMLAAGDAQACFNAGGECEAYVIDETPGGRPLVLDARPGTDSSPRFGVLIFAQSPGGGGWALRGWMTLRCSPITAALRAGKAALAPSASEDLVIGGQRAQIVAPPPVAACPGSP